jgi:hypothetical protein
MEMTGRTKIQDIIDEITARTGRASLAAGLMFNNISHPRADSDEFVITGQHEVRAHFFASTEEAYGRTQTDDAIIDGDLLIIPSERVIGILTEAWPIAITPAFGDLHTMRDDWDSIEGGRYHEIYQAARKVMMDMEWDFPPMPEQSQDDVDPCLTPAGYAPDGLGSHESTMPRSELITATRRAAVAAYKYGGERALELVDRYAHAATILREAALEEISTLAAQQFADEAPTEEIPTARDLDAINGLLSPVWVDEVVEAFQACVTAFMHDDMIAYARLLARFANLRGSSVEEAAKVVRDHVLERSGFIGDPIEEFDFGSPEECEEILIPWLPLIISLTLGIVLGAIFGHMIFEGIMVAGRFTFMIVRLVFAVVSGM